MGSAKKCRLDDLLVARGMVESRTRAKALIMAGQVRSGTQVLDKPGKTLPADLPLEVLQPSPYVSRAAGKLASFIARFPFPLEGARVLDVGASTGGFTDFLLQHGAAESVCVDVGHGQLHYKLQTDPRVHNLERVNARELTADALPYPDYDLIVMDVSFISILRILPQLWPLLKPCGRLVTLVKPQFEAGRAEADLHQGVIRDPAIHQRVVTAVLDFAAQHWPDAKVLGQCAAEVRGTSGNQEFLVGWQKALPAVCQPIS